MEHVIVRVCFVALLVSCGVFGTEWPLARCSRNDAHIDNCILNVARFSTNKLARGIPSLNLRPLEPMTMGRRRLIAKKGPVNLEVDVKSTVMWGASQFRFDSTKYQKNSHRLDLHGAHSEIKLIAQYSMKGRIFAVPLNSDGIVEIYIRNLLAVHSLSFKPRQGVSLDVQPKQTTKVLVVSDLKNPEKLLFNFTANRLNSLANRAFNDVMNSNWRPLFNSFKPSVESWLADVYTDYLDDLFRSFSFDEMFPVGVPHRVREN